MFDVFRNFAALRSNVMYGCWCVPSVGRLASYVAKAPTAVAPPKQRGVGGRCRAPYWRPPPLRWLFAAKSFLVTNIPRLASKRAAVRVPRGLLSMRQSRLQSVARRALRRHWRRTFALLRDGGCRCVAARDLRQLSTTAAPTFPWRRKARRHAPPLVMLAETSKFLHHCIKFVSML
jgi:hypothetical protein